MGAMSGIKAVFGLSGSGVPTGVNVSGTQRLGVSQTDVAPTGADIIYSYKITSTGSSDVATLDIASGDITQTSGTPSVIRRGSEIANLSGVDFEGADLPTLVRVHAILVECEAIVSSASIAFSVLAAFPDVAFTQAGQKLQFYSADGVVVPLGSLTHTFGASGGTLSVTIAGKSS